jgi:hypothetical protein
MRRVSHAQRRGRQLPAVPSVSRASGCGEVSRAAPVRKRTQRKSCYCELLCESSLPSK